MLSNLMPNLSERLFKQFCEDNNADHVGLLLYSEVRWLLKGNCLKRFMEFFRKLIDILSDIKMKHLLTINGKIICELFS